ncbi:MAG: hypothetical protein ABR616_18760 [Dermatophilaceae bacterium]
MEFIRSVVEKGTYQHVLSHHPDDEGLMFLLLRGRHPLTGEEVERPLEVHTQEDRVTGELHLTEIRDATED